MDAPDKADEATQSDRSDAVAKARAQLAELLQRVMADGMVDLRGLQDEVLANGHVTLEERRKVRTAVAVLKIPPAFL